MSYILRFLGVVVSMGLFCLGAGHVNAQTPAEPNWPWDMRAVSYRWADDFTWIVSHDQMVEAADSAAAHGYNAVVLWGRHFRLGSITEWPLIVNTLADVVEVFHSRGLRVFEHHSAALINEDHISNPLPWGEMLMDLIQWDISTGDHTVTGDGSFYLACDNKIPTQDVYSRHLTDLFTLTGLDGLMSDDVGFNPWSCVCRSCRDKCLAQYGFDLFNYPFPGSPPFFWYEPNHPDYRKYIRFHETSVADHYVRARAVLNTIRPEARLMACNCSFIDPGWSQTTGVSLDDMAPSLNVLFFEAYGTSLTSYLIQWAADAAEYQRGLGVGRLRHQPVLPLGYPGNSLEREFVWALGKTFGCRVWTDTDAEHLANVIQWEAAHRDLFYQPEMPANIAILYSTQSRDAQRHLAPGYPWGPHGLLADFLGWCEALLWANIPFHVITEEQLSDAALAPYRVLILPSATSLSDAQCARIAAWTAQGGSLVATAECAVYGATGAPRDSSGLAGVLGVDIQTERHCSGSVLVPDEDVFADCGGQIDEPVRQRYLVNAHAGTLSLGSIEAGVNFPAMVRHTYGNGNSVYLAFRLGAAAMRQVRECGTSCSDGDHFEWYGPQTPSAAGVICNLAAPVQAGITIEMEPRVPTGLIVRLHALADGRRVVQVLNATGANLTPTGQWQHVLKHYVSFPPIASDLEVTLTRPFTTPVIAHQPRSGDQTLAVNLENNSFTIPASALASYVAVEIGPPPAPGDFNRDGRVDLADLARFASCWLQDVSVGTDCIACNLFFKDTTVNLKDFAVFAANWSGE